MRLDCCSTQKESRSRLSAIVYLFFNEHAKFLSEYTFVWTTVVNRPFARSLQYGINYGTQITQWDFKNKGKSSWTGASSFALEVSLCNLRPNIIY